MKFRYSPRAEEDLIHVLDEVYEASRDKDVTEKYLSNLMDRVEAKAKYPRSGTPLYWYDHFTGYYYVAFKAYIAFYYPSGDGICIDRILHARSDYMRHLIAGPRRDDDE